MLAVLHDREPVQAGRAHLQVDCVADASTVTAQYSTSPMKLVVPRARGRSVWAYTSSFGGGMVAGDQTHLGLRLGPQARCFLGSQAWTKIYRNPGCLPSRHVTQATLAAGAILVFAPDPIQAFAGSRYTQAQQFHLEAEASLFLLDWFTAGRVALGERWAFEGYQSRNEAWVDGVRLLDDALHLSPGDGTLTAPHRLGRFNCLATLWLIGPAFRTLAEATLQGIHDTAVRRRADLVMNASPVRGGCVLRLAATDFEQVAQELRPRVAGLSDLLADDPWSRKW